MTKRITTLIAITAMMFGVTLSSASATEIGTPLTEVKLVQQAKSNSGKWRIQAAREDRERAQAVERVSRAQVRVVPQPVKPKSTPQPVVPAPTPKPVRPDSVWDRLAACESSGDWANNDFHDGGLQFLPRTWNSFKLAGYPQFAYQASKAQQIAVAEKVLAAQGWGAWPECSRKVGLR